MREIEELQEAIQEMHKPSYDSVADEVYERNAVCDECQQSYPCPTVLLAGPVLPRCNCGWGGVHDPDSPRCDRNQATAQ